VAVDVIKVNNLDTNAKMAADVLRAVRLARELYELTGSLRLRAYHLFEGSDFTALEEACGLEPGHGQTLFTLIDGTHGVLDGTFQNANAIDLMNRVL